MSEFDLIVVGGGIMGCSAALRAREYGMRVALIERSAIGSGASGVNAGTLSLQIKRVALIPYAIRGYRWWQDAGDKVGFRRTGGLTLAFNEREAALLEERMRLKIAAGGPIELVPPGFALQREPSLTSRVIAASWCADDGYASANRTGTYLRALLREAGVTCLEYSPVEAIDSGDDGFRVAAPQGTFKGRRLLLAAGAWTKPLAAKLGVEFPVHVRINTVSVLERGPATVGSVIGHASGLLTLKQKADGTVLIGGGWQGRGSPGEGRGDIVPATMLDNLRLARFVVPSLAKFRLLRAWTGFEAHVPDFFPLAGALPGVSGAFVLSCVRGGYTIGPYIGRLLGDLIHGKEPEMKLFDPARFADRPAASAV